MKIHSFILGATLAASVFVFASPLQAAKTLYGHRPGVMSRLAAVGELPAGTNLSLSIGLPLPNPASLAERIREMHDPASTNYGTCLTRDESVAQYCPTEAQYEAAMAYATAHGLTVTTTYKDRLLFDATGSAADIEKLFHVRLRLYPHPMEKRQFFAPDSDPTIDDAFPILDVGGLDNFAPAHHNLTVQPLSTNLVVASNAAGSGPYGLLIGNDFRNAYAPGVTLNGYGQSIGLVQLGEIYYPQDIVQYEQLAGLPNASITNISVNGYNTSPTPGQNDAEAALDIEMALSMAPAATIMVYEGNSIDSIFNQMASDDVARQISSSYGVYPPSANLTNILSLLESQGQSVFVSSGDYGADTNNETTQVPFLFEPSGYPNITSVGGTELTLTHQNGSWQSETTWPGSGGGLDTNFALPSYQQGISMTANHGSTTLRNFPDVAAAAYSVFSINSGNGTLVDEGGTSAASPLWAGFMALVNEQASDNEHGPVAGLNNALYAIGQSGQYTSAFNDITTGNNFSGVSPANYSAVTGYDLCTGWGTPNGDNLINLLTPTPDPMQISPGYGFTASIPYGSTGSPAAVTFTLSDAAAPIQVWYVTSAPSWISLSSESGALGFDVQTFFSVTASLNLAVATNLPVGTYSGLLTIEDATYGFIQNRLFVLHVTAAAQPLAVSGFNADVVYPASGGSFPNAFDTQNNLAFYQAGVSGTVQGLPANGNFVSAWDGQTVFQLGSYFADNVLLLGKNYSSSGTLTLATPQPLNSLVVLAASADAVPNDPGTLTLHFTNGTSSPPLNYVATDWMTQYTNGALSGFGRLDIGASIINNYGSSEPTLFQTTLPLGALGLTQAIGSVTFNVAPGATNTGIFALSGLGGALSGLKPAITQPPQSVTNFYPTIGEDFTVGVSGAAPLGYQWYSNNVALPYQISSTLNFNPVIATNDAANYQVVITNQFGTVSTIPVSLSVYRSKPVITQQPVPANVSLFTGGNASFTGAGSSLIPFTAEWYFKGSPIANATSATFALANAQSSNAGAYTLTFSNYYGMVTSAPVAVAVSPISSAPYPSAVLKLNPVAYWRLDETSGTTAFDCVNGNNGTYTNVTLGQAGYGSAAGAGTDPFELAALFGPTNGIQSFAGVSTIDLSVAEGGNGEFSVAAWVKATNTVINGAGIVAKGAGGGDEEFCLDCGGTTNAFRFFVRDAEFTTAWLASSLVMPDNHWHWLVGVCDQANSLVYLYVDGTNAAIGGIAAGTGIHHSSVPLSLGARQSGTGQPYNLQLIGQMDDAAIFNYALTGSQISALYSVASAPPPPLSIARANGSIAILWTTNAPANLVLQHNTALGTTNWTSVTNPVTMNGQGQYQVLVSPVGTNSFYRLGFP